jgi:hypothetical protein
MKKQVIAALLIATLHEIEGDRLNSVYWRIKAMRLAGFDTHIR